MIETIVLDIGNVLADFGWEQYLKTCGYDEEMIHNISGATVLNNIWKEWDRGAIEEEQIVELCCKQAPEVEQEIRSFLENISEVVKEYDYSADFVKLLKENGYQVYLLSNYSKLHFENNKKDFKFVDYVDGGIISHEIRHIKPEPAIYEALINKYEIDPTRSVFLDDVEINLEGAKPFGFHTILFRSIEQAKSELRSLGVRI
jgi:putative hydrolase of the HAD superfamily